MKIRRATDADTDFLAQVILLATRAHLGKEWFDILLDRSEPGCLQFLERLTRTSIRSWWHYSRFCIAEMQDTPAAALCYFRAGDGYPLSGDAVTEVATEMGWSSDEQS